MVRGWKQAEEPIKKQERKWLGRKKEDQESRSQAKKVFREGWAADKSAIQTLVQTRVWFLGSCVSLSKLLEFSEPHFPEPAPQSC